MNRTHLADSDQPMQATIAVDGLYSADYLLCPDSHTILGMPMTLSLTNHTKASQ